MGKRLKKIFAVCCAAAILAATPGMTVLASESREEALENVPEDMSEESSVTALQDDAAVPETTDKTSDEDLSDPDRSVNAQDPQQEDTGDVNDMELTEEEANDSQEEATGWSYVRFSGLKVGTNVTALLFSSSVGTGETFTASHVLTLTSNNGTLYDNWKAIIDDKLEGSFTNWREELTDLYIEETSDKGKLHLRCTSNSAEGTFQNLKQIEHLDLSRVDTSSMSSMDSMFAGCSNLKELDLSGFNTSNVKSMSGMFNDCYALESLDLSSFDTSNVNDMSSMFGYCYGLKSLDVSSFDTSGVLNMDSMFAVCSNLTHIDLTNFNTAKTVHMNYMFVSCYGLNYLDLSSFDMSSAVESPDSGIWKMLDWDNYIETFKTPKKINVDIELPREMYDGKGKAYTSVGPLNKSITLYYPKKLDIQYASISGVSLSYGYSGTPYSPSFKVTLNGKELVSGKDYTYKFQNNLNPGIAKLVITGKGSYFGTKTRTFEIVDCVSEVVSGKTYQLIPKNNSKTAVCAFSGRMVKNTKIYITDRSESEAMKFVAKKNANGTWKFVNAKCELVLAVQQNSSEVGKGVVLYDNTTKPAQNWKLEKKSDNSFAIINSVTGYSIAMSDESAVKGTTLSMAITASTGLQRFYIVETTPVDNSYDGTYSILASKNKKYGVDITAASKADGANVQLYTANGTNAQKFTAMYSGGGYYRLVNKNSGMVLTVKGNTKTSGANVIQSSWAGQSGQRWKIIENDNGTVMLKNVLGTVLHLNGNKIANGTNITAKTEATTGAQKWYLQK